MPQTGGKKSSKRASKKSSKRHSKKSSKRHSKKHSKQSGGRDNPFAKRLALVAFIVKDMGIKGGVLSQKLLKIYTDKAKEKNPNLTSDELLIEAKKLYLADKPNGPMEKYNKLQNKGLSRSSKKHSKKSSKKHSKKASKKVSKGGSKKASKKSSKKSSKRHSKKASKKRSKRHSKKASC
jgi:hypothetical protein